MKLIKIQKLVLTVPNFVTREAKLINRSTSLLEKKPATCVIPVKFVVFLSWNTDANLTSFPWATSVFRRKGVNGKLC